MQLNLSEKIICSAAECESTQRISSCKANDGVIFRRKVSVLAQLYCRRVCCGLARARIEMYYFASAESREDSLLSLPSLFLSVGKLAALFPPSSMTISRKRVEMKGIIGESRRGKWNRRSLSSHPSFATVEN